jgi:cation diffusion facilitator CzcD-associated flavoprotein CzcO
MSKKPAVAVIGAGLGGLAAGVKLKEAGFDDVTILEKAAKVGGTWRDNSYPGCCCDVPVALYQFSFAPSLKWSHLFPRYNEVQQYTEDMADSFGLRPHLHLNEETKSAVWDDTRAVWKITTSKGKSYEANAIVAALGQLNRPALPNIEGRESFDGPAFHSARWDHAVDLKGKRVAIIGSAASAVQIIPEVAKVAGHLSVFQRTANWLVPRQDRAITEEEKALMMTAPHVAMMNRDLIYQNSDYLFWQAFSWTEVGRAAYTRVALNHLAEQVTDPELRKKLTPDYPIGCKRILFADDYYLRSCATTYAGNGRHRGHTQGHRNEDRHETRRRHHRLRHGFRNHRLAVVGGCGGEGRHASPRSLGRSARSLSRHHGGEIPEHVHPLRPQHQPGPQLDHLHARAPGRLRWRPQLRCWAE